jgi:hypothetical protein
MRAIVRIVCLACLCASLSACSKKEAQPVGQSDVSSESVDPAQAAAPTVAEPGQRAPAQQVRLETVSASLQQQDYDAAVNTLIKAAPVGQNMTAAQQAQYYEQFRRTSAALQEAMHKDPKAAAAYKRLSQSVLKR